MTSSSCRGSVARRHLIVVVIVVVFVLIIVFVVVFVSVFVLIFASVADALFCKKV